VVLKGETIATGAPEICDCGEKVEWNVYHSGGGYYIGTYCPVHGPYSRESRYFRTKQEAMSAWDIGDFGR
jgi:hypothetical protein